LRPRISTPCFRMVRSRRPQE